MREAPLGQFDGGELGSGKLLVSSRKWEVGNSKMARERGNGVEETCRPKFGRLPREETKVIFKTVMRVDFRGGSSLLVSDLLSHFTPF